jgi:hypothetical protein
MPTPLLLERVAAPGEAVQRASAVLHFHEVGTPRPESPPFPEALLGPPRPGTAWLGVPPDPEIAAAFAAS